MMRKSNNANLPWDCQSCIYRRIFFSEQKYWFLKTSNLTNPNRAALTTPKRLKSQKGIFVSCIRMNPSHSNKKSNFARQNHMNNKLQLSVQEWECSSSNTSGVASRPNRAEALSTLCIL